MKITLFYQSKIVSIDYKLSTLKALRAQIALQLQLPSSKLLLFEYILGETEEVQITALSQLKDDMKIIIIENDYMMSESDQFKKASQFYSKVKYESSFMLVSKKTPEKHGLPDSHTNFDKKEISEQKKISEKNEESSDDSFESISDISENKKGRRMNKKVLFILSCLG